ncbi:translation initiation factor IF-2, partial [Candidatus Daviesbacteria bacterium]|nr:translation initiation factor IF-2 [Candidatus Daviesbacteria bacterium]
AFEKMRSRGAKVADIAVLVVAIDDGIMPQTIEAIKHIQAAKVSMIVAINKIDLPGVDKNIQMQKIKKQLSDHKVVIEEYGGDVPIVELSAKSGEGVDKLLEVINLVAEMHELKGDDFLAAGGVVIESSLDKFKGPVATLLIRNGTLKKGDMVLIGGVKGKIRGMFDYAGKPLEKAGPSAPVEILGLEAVPPVGATLGQESQGLAEAYKAGSLLDKLSEGGTKTLKLIIKADKQGSLEAIQSSLDKFNEENKVVEFISTGTGDITEENIKTAGAVGAIVIGFNVKVAPTVAKLAETEQVLVRTYNIIYELLEEMEEVIDDLLRVGQVEEVLGRAEVIAEFPYGKNERIAGCRILEGSIAKGQRIRVVRDNQILVETKLKSLKKVKEEVNKVEKGNDCGMMFEPPLDFQIGDFVESFRAI